MCWGSVNKRIWRGDLRIWNDTRHLSNGSQVVERLEKSFSIFWWSVVEYQGKWLCHGTVRWLHEGEEYSELSVLSVNDLLDGIGQFEELSCLVWEEYQRATVYVS